MNNNEKILKRAHKAKVFAIINLLLLVAAFVYVIVNGSIDIECFWFKKGYDASKYAFYIAAPIFALSALIGLIVSLGSKNSPDWENLKSDDPYTVEDQGNSIRSLAKANGVRLPIVFPSMLITLIPIAFFLVINFNVMGFAWLHNGPDDVDVDAILAKQEKLEEKQEEKDEKEDKDEKDDSDSKDEDESKVDEKIDSKDVNKRVEAMIKIGESRGYTCTSSSLDDTYFVNFNPEKILEDESLTIMIEKDGTITMVSYSCYFLPDLSVDENLERVESKIGLLTDMVEEFYDKGLIDSKEYYANVGLSSDFKDKIKNHSGDDDFIMDDGEMDINSKYNTSASCMFFDDDTTVIGIDVMYFD